MINTTMTMKTDKQPWYREPWPWFLISLPLTAVVAGIVTLVLAIRSNDGLVTDDYYKQGLGINKVLARQEMAEQMGLRAELRMTGKDVDLTLQGHAGMGLPDKVSLSISHPTRAGEDDSIVLVKQGDHYVGTMDNTFEGHRNVMLEDVAGVWRLSSSAIFPSSAPVRIESSVPRKNG